MTESITTDNPMRAAGLALDGLAKQADTIGNNIANVDTPGFRAQTLDFQSMLKNALNGSGNLQMKTTNVAHLLPTNDASSQAQVLLRKGGSSRADGNNVNMDVELEQMSETVLQYQTLSQLINKKFNLIRTISQAAR